MAEAIQLTRSTSGIRDNVKHLIPDGNLSACLTCGTCTSGCPATGLMDMDPRKFLRMAVFGMDREGAYFALNQNSREPVTEPDELMPLWKILHKAGAD